MNWLDQAFIVMMSVIGLMAWMAIGYEICKISRTVNSPLWQIQHPATEELRQIYREIDQDIVITDPELLTPEKETV